MEDKKLEQYYMSLKNAAPVGRQGALGYTGSRRNAEYGDKEIDKSTATILHPHTGEMVNPLYRRFVKAGFKKAEPERENKKITFDEEEEMTINQKLSTPPTKKRKRVEKEDNEGKEISNAFSWKEKIRISLQNAENKSMRVKKLRKVVIALYKLEMNGEEILNKEGLKALFEKKINKIKEVVVEGKMATLKSI